MLQGARELKSMVAMTYMHFTYSEDIIQRLNANTLEKFIYL